MKYLASLSFVLLFMTQQGFAQDSFAFASIENLTKTKTMDTSSAPDYYDSYKQISNQIVAKINYPDDMRMYGVEGKSTIAVTIAPNGKLTDVTIVESLGFAFDKEIKEVLSNARVNSNFTKEETIVFPVLFRLSR